MIDPRQLMLSGFFMDASTAALLRPPVQSDGGGKMSSSFRISDLLHSPDEPNSSQSSDEGRESPVQSHSHREDSLRGSPIDDTPSGSKKTRKARTIFTDKQLQELESTFEKQKYLSVQDRIDLAQRMGLSDTQVKTWYQNRRTKWKRQASVGMDLLADANNLAAVQHLLRTNPYWSSYLNQATLTQPRPFLPVGMPLTSATSMAPVAGFPLFPFLMKPDKTD